MKAAILSINLHTKKINYGAVLHSWCFQQLLKRRADVESCEIIDYVPSSLEGEDLRLYNIKLISSKAQGKNSAGSAKSGKKRPDIIKASKTLLRGLLITPAHILRFYRFRRFFRENLKISPKQYTEKQLDEATLPYDAVFFESDVIWSPAYFEGRFERAFFGALDSMKAVRKIVYSASMGEAKLTDAQRSELRELLKYPDAISMRETYASQIVRALTDKPVADVVDPVLLAEPEDFEAITARRLIKEDYLLVYFPILPDKKTLLCARRYAREHGLKVVEVSDQPLHSLKNRTYASGSIENFLSLIKYASVVFAASLHGMCLSLLFQREFYAFERAGGGRKYQDLCQKFQLDDRYIRLNSAESHFKEATPIDWAKTNALRESFRRESLEWLDAQIGAVGREA